MKLNNVAGFRNIDEYVSDKLEKFNKTSHDFKNLFELMFSERDNIMYERSVGYRIVKTTYGEAYNNIVCRAAMLAKKLSGTPSGSVVGLYMENSLEWIENFWAILKCGFRPLLLNLRLDYSTLCKALSETKAVAVVSGGKQFEIPTILSSELDGGKAENSPNVEFGGELLVMSSGTTGKLKLCGYSAEELYWQINDSAQIVKESKQIKQHCDGELKLLTFLPFYHIFGLFAMYIWFAFFSRSFVHLGDMSSQTVQNTIRRHRVTHIFAVPLFWETVYNQAIRTIKNRDDGSYEKLCKGFSLCRKVEKAPAIYNALTKTAFKEVRDNIFGDSIRFMITGGSSIKPQVISFFNDIGYHLVNGYGMTELGITSVELSNKGYERNRGFVGRPLSSVEYKIDENGQLLVRGTSIAKYIIENGHMTYNDGKAYFATNDLATEENGRYRILGRRDDMIVLPDGENLNPALIEPLLQTDGCDICLVSSGASATLVVSLGISKRAEYLDALQASLRERISEFKLSSQIKNIVFTSDPLMRPDEFKINRGRIKNDLNEGKLKLISSDTSCADDSESSELEARIRIMFAVALGKESADIGLETDFFADEGGSSLEYFALIAKIQDEFGVPMPTEQGHSISTVREIAAFIEERYESLV